MTITDEALNMEICAWRGWEEKPTVDAIPTPWGASAIFPRWQFHHQLPSHITDLNAMHEAENGLTKEQRYKWLDELCEETGCPMGEPYTHHDALRVALATARQRAIALLRVVKPELFQ